MNNILYMTSSARSQKIRGNLELYHAYIRDLDSSGPGSEPDWELVDNEQPNSVNSVSIVFYFVLSHISLYKVLNILSGTDKNKNYRNKNLIHFINLQIALYIIDLNPLKFFKTFKWKTFHLFHVENIIVS